MTKFEWMQNKIPQVTIYFWVIKILCTTVGETAADYLNVSLNFGLAATSIVMGVLLVAALFFQFKSKRYIPGVYWLAVFLISIFGTLVTDILTDELHVALELSTIVFSVLLAGTFALWFWQEKTLAIDSIDTFHREAFYWLAVLFTFALGTAAGDLMAEGLGLGYLVTGLIVCGMIAALVVAWHLGLDSVLAFWIIYILTRPLGASIGDYLSQSPAAGGLGLGPSVTTAVFVLAILCTVLYLTLTKKDEVTIREPKRKNSELVIWQVAGVVVLLIILSVMGYFARQSQLQNSITLSVSPAAPLGDLSVFRKIAEDTLSLVREEKLADAKTRIGDLEYEWDESEAKLKPMSEEAWSQVDDAIDAALRKLRARSPDSKACEESLVELMKTLDSISQVQEVK